MGRVCNLRRRRGGQRSKMTKVVGDDGRICAHQVGVGAEERERRYDLKLQNSGSYISYPGRIRCAVL